MAFCCQNSRFLGSYLNFGLPPLKSTVLEGRLQEELYIQADILIFLCVNVSNSICILRSGAKSEVKCYHQDKTLSLLAPSFKQMTQ